MIEKERKFLVDWDKFSKRVIGLACEVTHINQWYGREQLNGFDVRFRHTVNPLGAHTLYMTLKRATCNDDERVEYETQMNMMRSEFREMLRDLGIEDRCIRKRRITSMDFPGELDIFEDGTVLYEIEDYYPGMPLPDFVTKDVTGDPKYYNINMLKD